MGQVLDDDAMALALEEAQRKSKAGERMRPKIAEEDYIQPFAGTFVNGCDMEWLSLVCLFMIEHHK